MFEACLPLGPCTTSKLTFWPSLRVLKPDMLIAEKCANKSSLPSSGVMKPYPFASLNHFTVPVAMLSPLLPLVELPGLVADVQVPEPCLELHDPAPHWRNRQPESKHSPPFTRGTGESSRPVPARVARTQGSEKAP